MRTSANLNLTPAQFDIIATLGNTDGMTCKELGEKTLITKGTMTGVLDRLEGKALLVRVASPDDGRSWITKLTRKGQALFEEIFPAHMKHLDPLFRQHERHRIENAARAIAAIARCVRCGGRRPLQYPIKAGSIA